MHASAPGDEWKDHMFRLHACEFVQVLDARPVSADLQSILFGASGPSARFAVLDLGCGSGRFLPSISKFATISQK